MSENLWNIDGELYTDQEIVSIILKGDRPKIAEDFFYKTCYPLFAKIYNNFYTDCENPIEFINEIFAYLLYENKNQRTPDRRNCKLAKFGFRCSLTTWIKLVTENYCRYVFAKKMQNDENFTVESDRIDIADNSIENRIRTLDMEDAIAVLNSMPNERYRKLIQYRYLEEKTNEETALLLSMSMANYYNKHKLAKAQYCEALKKEGLL